MSCKRKTGIAFVIEERDDGTFRAMMGSNKDMPQDGMPLLLAVAIMDGVSKVVEEYNKQKEDKDVQQR